ncbi:MAG: tRNA (adenosine(37)-N6)-threonylcarbamoyltransferase complex transferase subunit TsaD [Desulfotomaculales bacterium]
MGVIILGIETSCDETAVAVVADGHGILANLIASQTELHAQFGGVVPEVASRRHLETINPLLDRALEEAGVSWRQIDGVAVTQGPGLLGSLLVGVMTAKALTFALGVPLLAVNHLEAHIYANFLVAPDLPFPLLCLVVSGGHTDLFFLPRRGEYRLLGRTRDDAAGEAFDKVARVMGLGYPGGPAIERAAAGGNPAAVPLPRAYLEEGSYDFSFSGLKTAVVNYLARAEREGTGVDLPDLAASFQQAVVEVLVEKVLRAAEALRPASIALAGGVAANRALREMLLSRAGPAGFRVHVPPPALCTDNAAMVACAGYYRYLRGETAPMTLNAVANLEVEQAAWS